jgi:hypothetical protein
VTSHAPCHQNARWQAGVDLVTGTRGRPLSAAEAVLDLAGGAVQRVAFQM